MAADSSYAILIAVRSGGPAVTWYLWGETTVGGAIVLGSNLSVVQELGRNGISCTIMLHHRTPSTFSRYANYIRCPNPSIQEDLSVNFLYDHCRKLPDPPVVIPASDQWAMALSRHRKQMEEVCVPCVADREAVELVLDKERFCRLGQERGYMTPRCWCLGDMDSIGKDDFPILVKPKRHRWSSNDDHRIIQNNMVRLRFNLIRDREEMTAFLAREERFLDHLFFQEYVEGPSSNLYDLGAYIDRSSRILASVGGHKIRGCIIEHGDCNLGERTTLPEELVDNAGRIIKELGITGLVEFEYKKDPATGVFKLIEVNPRPWSWIGITPACDVSLPLIAYKNLAGSLDSPIAASFEGSVKYVRLLSDLPNSLIYYRKNRNEDGRSFREWRTDIKADRLVFYEFDHHDPFPAVVLFTYFAQSMFYRAIGAVTGQAEGGIGGSSAQTPSDDSRPGQHGP